MAMSVPEPARGRTHPPSEITGMRVLRRPYGLIRGYPQVAQGDRVSRTKGRQAVRLAVSA